MLDAILDAFASAFTLLLILSQDIEINPGLIEKVVTGAFDKGN